MRPFYCPSCCLSAFIVPPETSRAAINTVVVGCLINLGMGLAAAENGRFPRTPLSASPKTAGLGRRADDGFVLGFHHRRRVGGDARSQIRHFVIGFGNGRLHLHAPPRFQRCPLNARRYLAAHPGTHIGGYVSHAHSRLGNGSHSVRAGHAAR